MRLYVAAFELPDLETETESADENRSNYTISCSEGFETLYWAVFDPFNNNPEKEVVCMSLYDDLRSILEELQDEISEYEARRIGNAVFNWKFGYEIHVGAHTVNALKALHVIRTKK